MSLRKNYQRKVNKTIRNLNESILEDNLWKGRFVFKQIWTGFHRYEDGSGGSLHCIVRGYDKLTGYYKDFRMEYFGNSYFLKGDFWVMANDFIVEYANVWSDPYQNNLKIQTSPNFKNIPYHFPELSTYQFNFYKSYKEEKG